MAKEKVNYQEVLNSGSYAAKPKLFASCVQMMEQITKIHEQATLPVMEKDSG